MHVSADDVRDVINITSEKILDNKVLKMIKDAEVTLELETDKRVNNSNCKDAEKEAITVLSAVYAICYLTGGSAVGPSFSVGDPNISILDKAPPLNGSTSGTGTHPEQIEGYEAIVDAADIIKMAKMLRILGFLIQSKVYLFWKKGCLVFNSLSVLMIVCGLALRILSGCR